MKAFVDIETTGLSFGKAEVITLGIVVADDRLDIVYSNEYNFRPEFRDQWGEKAEEVHGISWDQAQSFPNKKDSLIKVVEDISDEPMDFICHARPSKESVYKVFDYGHIFHLFLYEEMQNEFYKMFPEDKVFSTILPSKKEAQSTFGIENQKLGTWADKLGIEFNHHNALEDAKALYEVYKYQQGFINATM